MVLLYEKRKKTAQTLAIHIHSTGTVHIYTVQVQCTYTQYKYSIHLQSTGTVHIYTVQGQYTCIQYRHCIHIHSTGTVHIFTFYTVHI